MAKYTVELREIVESGLKIFNFNYEFYDNNKKSELEEKFIEHFFFREIGCETVGRFQHYLKCKCNEILPYYNMLFKTAQYEYDLVNNYNLTETLSRIKNNSKDNTGTSKQTGNSQEQSTINDNKNNTLNSETKHTENIEFTKTDNVDETGKIDKTTNIIVDDRKVHSETPQALLSIGDIKNNLYANNADMQDGKTETKDNQSSTANKKETSTEDTKHTSTDNVNGTTTDISKQTSTSNLDNTSNINTSTNEKENEKEDYTLTRIGDIGVDTVPDKLLKHIELQKILTTIYQQFFNACDDLFMQIF